MTNQNLLRIGALAIFSASGLSAQNNAAWKMPRTADGHPDLQGIWSSSTRTPLERPAWTVELPFAAAAGPIYEYACHEGNYAIEDILGGARKIEAEETPRK